MPHMDPWVSNAAAAHRIHRPTVGWPVIVAFHWSTVVLVLAAVGMALGRELVEGRDSRMLLLDIHRQLGLAVFLLTVVRLASRARGSHEFGVHARGLHGLAVALSHGAFYLLLAALPLLGYLTSSLRGQTVHLLGLPLPALMERDRDLADIVVIVHEWAAWTLLALAGAHAAAALWHHHVRRDDTLARMVSLRAGQ
jgi:cytochrome b561